MPHGKSSVVSDRFARPFRSRNAPGDKQSMKCPSDPDGSTSNAKAEPASRLRRQSRLLLGLPIAATAIEPARFVGSRGETDI